MTHVVRRVLPHEYSNYRAHLKKLDPESRTLRFAYPATDYHIDKLCDLVEANQDQHILFCIENFNLEFIGVGHIALEGDKMELAFSVLKEYQHQGIGNALMTRCIQWCRTHDYLDGQMVCLSSNSTIKHLCRKHGITMENDHGETTADIHLPAADVTTYVKEVFVRNEAVVDWFAKRSVNPWVRQFRRSTTQ